LQKKREEHACKVLFKEITEEVYYKFYFKKAAGKQTPNKYNLYK